MLTIAALLLAVAPGQRISVPELNFAVSTPSPDWEWAEAESADGRRRQFVCRSPEGGGLTLIAFGGRFQPFEERELDELEAGLTASWADQGFQVSELRHERTEIAGREGHRFRYRLTGSDGTVLHGFRYALVAGHLYSLEGLSLSEQEPLELQSVIGSFELLKEPAVDRAGSPLDPSATFGVMMTFSYIVLLGLCALATRIVNALAGTRFDGWRFGAFVVVGLAALFMVYFFSRPLPEGLMPFQQGELFGAMVVGPVIWPVLLAWFLSRRFRRATR